MLVVLLQIGNQLIQNAQVTSKLNNEIVMLVGARQLAKCFCHFAAFLFFFFTKILNLAFSVRSSCIVHNSHLLLLW